MLDFAKNKARNRINIKKITDLLDDMDRVKKVIFNKE